MRKVVCTEFGPVDQLRVVEAPDPEPGDGQVLVRVHAAGVSFVDGVVVRGGYPIKLPFPFTPGAVFAGELLASKRDAGVPPVGTRVLGLLPELGSYSTHVVTSHLVLPIPDNVPATIAASALESYGTMAYALTRRITVTPDQWVLVLGAGGGIGLAAVDIARSLGAKVIAVASTEEKRQAALRAGAEAAIDYQDGDLKKQIRELTSGIDVVVDPVGGPSAESALRTLRWNGTYLVIGFASGTIPTLPLNHVLLNGRSVVGIDFGAWAQRQIKDAAALVKDILHQFSTGQLRPPTPQTYPLDRVSEALTALEQRAITGKAVLTP